jgi:hypothetical protein
VSKSELCTRPRLAYKTNSQLDYGLAKKNYKCCHIAYDAKGTNPQLSLQEETKSDWK